jgi:tetratricopeptide (TPR) repeat protein
MWLRDADILLREIRHPTALPRGAGDLGCDAETFVSRDCNPRFASICLNKLRNNLHAGFAIGLRMLLPLQGERAGVRADLATSRSRLQRSTLQAAGFALVLLSISVFPLRAEDSSSAFDAANRLYAQNKFPEAAAGYEQLIAAGSVAPALYFNLGNASFKSGQIGRAIAAYRQAGALTPRDPDVRANLQFARAQVSGPTLRANLLQRALGTLSLNEWTGLSAVALWITFVLLAWRQIRPPLATALRNWTWLAGAVALTLCVTVALAYLQDPARNSVIVAARETTVRNGPFDESPGAFTANDGAELRLLDRKDDWLQVTDGTRRIGWVKRDAVICNSQP